MATEYASSATDGAGTTFEVGDGASPEVFTAVAESVRVTPGAFTTAAIDVTHLLSPNAHAEKIPGKRDTGAFGIDGNYLPGNVTQSNDASPGGLIYLARTRAVRNFKIVLGNSGSPAIEVPIRGFIDSFQLSPFELGVAKTFKASFMPSQDVSASLP